MEKKADVFFDDEDYVEMVFGVPDREELKNAFEIANKCREKEIQRFWTRGTYFWAFILGSYTGHFAVLGQFLKCFCIPLEQGKCQVVCPIVVLVFLFLIVVSSFCALFFSYSWFLVNKGSKFWQKNWESVISNIEEPECGKLFDTFLNTKAMSKKGLGAYDFSVSRVTIFGSFVLTVISAVIFAFDCVSPIIFGCVRLFGGQLREDIICIVSVIVLLACLVYGFFIVFKRLPKKCEGNVLERNGEKVGKWRRI